ncbi:hypothetical protein BABINDRAFT_10194 [Babjeviella inositovora NRRL Y-12698]|uniref:Ribosomal protein/NADH dehydrogenase domain-containing protein n=1 Tax=Babjeviella inositovora NRRL Y-12698 TaxID=984486 RepID=A0A1E3QHX1_9ASCO|nr:uncharacterized protein BABINDRAFT_10194 [Babjeviella inositovora NRRL Y-12698]ODQ77286.1 hypothetical protein BABINDRAFT_10194 [Babjeviella inositovora NRRL Y-12698]
MPIPQLIKRVATQAEKLNRIAGVSNPSAAIRINTANVTSFNALMPSNVNLKQIGLKDFWRTYLPVVKFHNPEFPISVQRVHVSGLEQAAKVPAVLTITKASGEKVEIDCLGKSSGSIWNEVLEKLQGSFENVALEEIPTINAHAPGKQLK